MPNTLVVRRLLLRPRWRQRVFDSFSRPDSALTLGNAETGQAWSVSGTWGISAGQAYCVSGSNEQGAWINSGVADAIIECIVNGQLMDVGGYRLPSLIFRLIDTDNLMLALMYTGGLQLRKFDGGIWTTLASAAMTTANGVDYLVRAVLRGNLVQVLVDGVLLITYTLAGGDTKYSVATMHGMQLQQGGAPTVAARWDNFRVLAL